jgi:hypothetical protein
MKLWHAEDGVNYERLYTKQHFVSEKKEIKKKNPNNHTTAASIPNFQILTHYLGQKTSQKKKYP